MFVGGCVCVYCNERGLYVFSVEYLFSYLNNNNNNETYFEAKVDIADAGFDNALIVALAAAAPGVPDGIVPVMFDLAGVLGIGVVAADGIGDDCIVSCCALAITDCIICFSSSVKPLRSTSGTCVVDGVDCCG